MTVLTPLLAAPILLSLTLLVSGAAKLGHAGSTRDAMVSLRLGLRPLHRPIAAALPVAEIVLAIALWLPGRVLPVIAAALVAVLMIAYLVIIARALWFDERVECSCFGTWGSPTVSAATLLRNIVLSVLGLVAVALALSGGIGRALQAPASLLGWALALAVAVVLAVVTVRGAESADPAARGDAVGAPSPTAHDAEDAEDELLDYERRAIPAGVLQRPDGSLVTLRQLAGTRAVLLLFVTEGCGPCERVMDSLAGWLPALEPYMQVNVVLRTPVERLRERTANRVGALALHDPQFSARESLGGRGAPSAVLLGADGMLAGGPVVGGDDVISFVEDILAGLREAQEAGELPGPEAGSGDADGA